MRGIHARWLLFAIATLLLLPGCAPVHQTPPPPTPPPTVAFDVVFCADVAPADNYCPGVPNAKVGIYPLGNYTTDGNGYLFVTTTVPAATGIEIAAQQQDYEDFDSGTPLTTVQALVATNAQGLHNFMRMRAKSHDVDPSTIPLNELARIRGAMWSRANVCADSPLLPFGPRPGRADNIIGTPYIDNYNAAQQEAIFHCLSQAGYTNVVTGGIIDTWGYHGLWTGHDYSTDDGFERWLDQHQAFWNHGLRPVTFFHVDGESYEQTEARLVGLVARHPRAQKLMRIVVISGWEPARYEWSSCTWAKYVALGKRLFPNALNLIHTVSDTDAPAGGDTGDPCNDNGKGNGQAWRRVVDAGLHGWLIQNGPYNSSPGQDPELTRNFAAQFQPDGPGAEQHGVVWHFKYGIDGWPTYSAWGPGIPLCTYNAENTAYYATWNNVPPEAGRQGWGNLAIGAPGSVACGYLDGGSAVVPLRR